MSESFGLWTDITKATVFLLLDFAWQSSLLIAVAFGVIKVFRIRGATTRHFLLVCALFGVGVLPLANPVWTRLHISRLSVGAIPREGGRVTRRMQSVVREDGAGQMARDRQEAVRRTPSPAEAPRASETLSKARKETQSPWMARSKGMQRIGSHGFELLFGVWVTGILLGLFRVFWGYRTLRRLEASGHPVEDASVLASYEEVLGAVGLRRKPELLASGEISAPMAIGALDPVVLVPDTLGKRLLPDKQRMVLLHELVHIKRHDLLLGLYQRLLHMVWFFHPLIRYLNRRMTAACEDRCDALVLEYTGEPTAYARALVEVLGKTDGHAKLPLFAGAGLRYRSRLAHRIRSILDGIPVGSLPRWGISVGVAVTCILVGLTSSITIFGETGPPSVSTRTSAGIVRDPTGSSAKRTAYAAKGTRLRSFSAEGYSIGANSVIIDRKEHWEEWDFPGDVVDLGEDGTVRPHFFREEINACLDASRFVHGEARGGIRDVGTDPLGAIDILDGDMHTFWEPDRDDPLEDWWVEVDLGRLVSAAKIVVRFAEKGTGDPFLKFRVLTSDGDRVPETPMLDWREAARIGEPNKTRREFSFDLEALPAGRHPSWTGDVIQYVRVVVMGTDRDKGEWVSQEAYEALDPEQKGVVEYVRITPSGKEEAVNRNSYTQLPPEQRGPIRYYRRELPRLCELEVWAAGDNISLGMMERGGSVDLRKLYTPDISQEIGLGNVVDGAYLTYSNLVTYVPPNAIRALPTEGMVLDLGTTFWVDEVRVVVMRPRSWPCKPGVVGYALHGSDGTRNAAGDLAWERLSPESRENIFHDEVGASFAMVAAEAFDLRKTRYLRLRYIDQAYIEYAMGAPYDSGDDGCYAQPISEIQVYGQGYVPGLTLTSPHIEVGTNVNLTSIEWEADTLPSTGIEIRTRTGDTLKELVHYFSKGGTEITAREYLNLPFFVQGPTMTELVPGEGWSSWSRPYPKSGASIESSGRQRYLQIAASLMSDDPNRYATLRAIRVNFFRPLASGIVGEIFPPRALTAGRRQEFSLFLHFSFVPSDPGFDEIIVVSPLKAEMAFQEMLLRDGEAVLRSFDPSEVEMHTSSSDTLRIRAPGGITPEGPSLVEICFASTVFLNRTPFEVIVVNTEYPDAPQFVEPGDATDLVKSETMRISIPFSNRILGDVSISPNPFTPNGDGVNDEAVFAFSVFKANLPRRVEIHIYRLDGRRIRTLSERRDSTSGRYAIPWDGKDENGGRVAPGTYLARVHVDADSETAEHTSECRPIFVAY